MARLADGERSAFDPLYEALWPIVRRFCNKALGSSAESDDAAQAALLEIFSRACDFEPQRSTRWEP